MKYGVELQVNAYIFKFNRYFSIPVVIIMIFKHHIRFCVSILVISISCDNDGDEGGIPQRGFYAFGTQNASAVYWKNGKPIDVDGNTTYFTGAAVSGSDVYAIGYVNDGKTYHGAAYWKNGKMFKLSKISMNHVPTAIAFDGSDMYIAGYEDMADKSFAICLAFCPKF